MEVIEKIRQSLSPKYEVEEEIGRGGFAYVFRARDARNRRDVAVKVLNPELWNATTASERFKRETDIVSTLQHPNILPLFDSGIADGVPYFVMPLVAGDSLADRLQRDGPLPIDEAVEIAKDIASGLSHAHSRGIVHRDIKPANILLIEGRGVLADFGIARVAEESADTFRTATGHAPGTPAYMSPEQAGSQDVDARSDLYSLGCVLFEALSGEPPFSGRTAQAVIARHMYDHPPSLEVFRPTIPSGIAETVEKALNKVPADRIQSAELFLEAIERGRSTPVRTKQEIKVARKSWTLLAALMVAAAVGYFIIPALVGHPPQPNDQHVVVFPFVGVEDVGEDGLGWNVALAIQTALEHTDPLKAIDGREWLEGEARSDPSLLTPDAAGQIAAGRGAGRYVSGFLLAQGDSVGVTVRLHDSRGGEVLGRETAWAPAGTDVYGVALAAVEPLLPRLLDPGQPVDLTPLTDRATGAVALAIQGDRAYRESRYSDAVSFYERALEEDSLLAIAAARGATAAVWEEKHREALSLADRAVRLGGDLPERYQRFVQGVQGYLSGELPVARENLEAALELEPNWPEAETALGEAYYHLLPSDIDPMSRSLEIFQDLADRHPEFTPPLLHLAESAIRRKDLASARGLIAQIERASGPDRPAVARLSRMVACVEEGGAAPEAWTRLATAHPEEVMAAALALAAGGAQPTCAEQALLAMRELGGEWAWGSTLALQSLWIGEGRVQEALALLEDSFSEGLGGIHPLYVFDAGICGIFQEGARRAEDVARNALGDRYRGANGMNLWLLGVWFAAQGNPDRAETLVEELEAQVSESHGREARMLAAALRAHVHLARDELESAIRILTDLQPTAPLWRYTWEFHEALAAERIRLARAFLATGEYERALHFASLFDQPGPVTYLAHLGPSLEIRARAAGALGRTQQEREFRDRLTHLGWESGEAPLLMKGPLLAIRP